mmetsp:Transcript_13099/g.12697  ORF Transcript_13099/g.12697 Transcript_13099/m.12697 type:complete len:90 (-) Transcript_13099:117-386(-)
MMRRSLCLRRRVLEGRGRQRGRGTMRICLLTQRAIDIATQIQKRLPVVNNSTYDYDDSFRYLFSGLVSNFMISLWKTINDGGCDCDLVY